MLNIFLVDDDPIINEFVEFALAGIDHKIQTARDGAEGLQITNAMTAHGDQPYPDVVLLDLNMPKVDGPHFLREFRKHPGCAHTPVIIVSGSNSAHDHRRLEGLEISGFFPKPLCIDDYRPLGSIILALVQRHVP